MLAIQRTRVVVYSVASLLAIAARLTGVIEAPPVAGIIAIAGVLSGFGLAEVYRRGVHARWTPGLELGWLVLDSILISLSVALSGGLGSPWFVWYLANVCAAAFVGGRRTALLIAGLDVTGYLAVLAAIGQVSLLDQAFWRALVSMAFLFGAAFFCLRGIFSLQHKQQQVKRLQEEHEHKVEQLLALTQDLDQGTRALAEANIQIREADRTKSQFLANMSHELRTPLNSIIGFSEILLERLAGEIPTKHVRFLHNIHTSGQHLLAIINDILDLSKVEAGKMSLHPESLRVGAVIEGVLNVIHGMSARQRITFAVDVPDTLPPLEADVAKLKQILYNLLSNAVKFSPEHSTVWVTARHLPRAQSPLGVDAMVVSVTDRGIGIAPEDQALIFEEFRQADGSPTRAFGGTGLGLCLVQKFVELQGGLVRVESELGKGSTFTVTLPLRCRVPGVAAAAGQAEKLLPGDNRVLVVEDDVLAYQAISRALAEAGYFPIRARHGEEALHAARTLKPSAITLDIGLPGLSGWDVLKELKRHPATRGIPVVIISISDNRELGITLGADDYFVKPVDRGQLVARLNELAAPPLSSRPTRLLLVDDEETLHEMLAPELTRAGYTVEHAYSGSDGLARATRACPDVIVLDLMMPDLTGFEVAAALKQSAGTAQVPIVVLTAKDLAPHEVQKLEGKIAALVQKGQATSSRLVAAIRDLESRQGREVSRAR
jgi:signal transduction histidine kinase/DNA-binding response OmpR family regulator